MTPYPNEPQQPSKRFEDEELDALDEDLDPELLADLAGEQAPIFSEDEITKALQLEVERQGAEGVEDVSGAIP